MFSFITLLYALALEHEQCFTVTHVIITLFTVSNFIETAIHINYVILLSRIDNPKQLLA